MKSKYGPWIVTGGCTLLALALCATCQSADLSEAESAFNSGEYADCIQFASEAIESKQRGETWPLLKIRGQMAIGEYSEALATLEEALQAHRTSVRLRWVGRQVHRYNDNFEQAEKLTAEIDQLLRRLSWRYRDAPNLVTLGRYFLDMGADPKEVLGKVYGHAKKISPKYVEAYLASGDLALSKHDYQMAAEAFREAVELAPESADAHFGLARAFSPSDGEKARAELELVLKHNPHHVGGLLFLVDQHVDSERYEEATEVLDRVFQVNSEHDLAWAYRSVIAHLTNRPEDESDYRDRALKWWPTNPEIDHLIGRKLSQKYRFFEGAQYQRQALSFDAEYSPAKVQLCQDLLRLGREDEGWKLADQIYQDDGYNVVAHNLVTLHENITRFQTLESNDFALRMEASEAQLYGHLVLQLLQQAKETLCAKYDVDIQTPVIVEMFPRQQDFAIRTFGLPGGAGFLAVCFGSVITANSPASQGESPANWQATLWHEFCHVVTLQKSHNKMPRWLSEGISVYEERQQDKTWGQSVTPRYREMLLADDLTLVSQLSGAFLHPPSPMHLQFTYFQSSLVVEYLIEEYGLETLKRILDDLGVGMSINESLQRYAGSLDALDKEFAEYARARAKGWAPEADWAKPPEFLSTASPFEEEDRRSADYEAEFKLIGAALAEWNREHPNSFWGLQLESQSLISQEKWNEAKRPLEKLVKICPEFIGPNNAYTLLAKVHQELGETRSERAVLEEVAARDGSAVDVYRRLMELCTDAEDWPSVGTYADKTLAVNPLRKEPYRYLANAAESLGDLPRAIGANEALARLDPIDPAQLHYRLARLHRQAGDLTRARRHVLMSLEEAPRFRQALKLLLRIRQDQDGQKKADGLHSPKQTAAPDV